MRRTVIVTEYTAKGVKVENGTLVERNLDPIQYMGRTLTQAGIEKLFNSQLKDSEKVIITSETKIENVYEMDLKTFIEHATQIQE